MAPLNRSLITVSIKRHEGLRLKPYLCTAGKLTIGYGRNLEDKGISREEADLLLERDVTDAIMESRQAFAWLDKLDPVRAAVIVEMCANMGLPRLLGFKRMIAALQRGDYKTAAAEMIDSKWRVDVGARAYRLAHQMETGKVPVA